MSSTSILMVKRMERRNRGMESIRDTEDDAGPVFKRSKLAGAEADLTPGPSRSYSWS